MEMRDSVSFTYKTAWASCSGRVSLLCLISFNLTIFYAVFFISRLSFYSVLLLMIGGDLP